MQLKRYIRFFENLMTNKLKESYGYDASQIVVIHRVVACSNKFICLQKNTTSLKIKNVDIVRMKLARVPKARNIHYL